MQEMTGLRARIQALGIVVDNIEEYLQPVEDMSYREILDKAQKLNEFREQLDELDGKVYKVIREARCLRTEVRKFMQEEVG